MKAERGMRLVVICTCVSVCSSSSIFVVLNGFGCCFDSLYRNQVAHHVRRCRRLLFSQVHKCQQIPTEQNFKVNARCIPLKYSCVELALASPPLPSCLVLQFPLTPKHLSTRQGLKLARWKGVIVFNTEQKTKHLPFWIGHNLCGRRIRHIRTGIRRLANLANFAPFASQCCLELEDFALKGRGGKLKAL